MYCLEKLQRELAYFFDMDLRELPRVQDLLAAKGYTQVQKGDEIIKLEPSAQAESTLAYTDTKGHTHQIPTDIEQQWLETFGLKDLQETYTPQFSEQVAQALEPILQGESIKLYAGSLIKLIKENRLQYLDRIKPTLEQPQRVILQNDGALIFARDFGGEKYFTSVARNDAGEWIIRSNAPKSESGLDNKIVAGGREIYNSQAATQINAHSPYDDIAKSNTKLDSTIIPQTTKEKPKWSRAEHKKWKLVKLEQTKAAARELYEQLQPIYNQARPLLIKAKELKSTAKAKKLQDKAWKLIEQESKPFIKKLEQHELELDRTAFTLYPETASIKIQPKSNFDLEWKNKKRGAQGLKGAAKYRAQALQRLSEKDYMTPFEQATKASNPLTQLHALKFEILKDLHKAKLYINQQDYDKDLNKTYLGYVNRASNELDSIEQSIRELKNSIVPKPQRVEQMRNKVQDFIKWRDEVRFDTDYLLALESDGIKHALEYLERQLQAATLPQQANFINQLKQQIKEHFPTPPTPPSPPSPHPQSHHREPMKSARRHTDTPKADSSVESTPKIHKHHRHKKGLFDEVDSSVETKELHTKTTSKLTKDELDNLPIATAQEFGEFLEKIAQKDYQNTPEILKIATLNNDLQELINNNHSASVFITRARAGHISEARKGEYDQALTLEEQKQIPAEIAQAKEAYTDEKSGFILPFADKNNNEKINLIILDSDSKGNFLITAKKVNGAELNNPKYKKLARAGVEPATTTPPKAEQKPTEAISLARDEIIPQTPQEIIKQAKASEKSVGETKELLQKAKELESKKDLNNELDFNGRTSQWQQEVIKQLELDKQASNKIVKIDNDSFIVYDGMSMYYYDKKSYDKALSNKDEYIKGVTEQQKSIAARSYKPYKDFSPPHFIDAIQPEKLIQYYHNMPEKQLQRLAESLRSGMNDNEFFTFIQNRSKEDVIYAQGHGFLSYLRKYFDLDFSDYPFTNLFLRKFFGKDKEAQQENFTKYVDKLYKDNGYPFGYVFNDSKTMQTLKDEDALSKVQGINAIRLLLNAKYGHIENAFHRKELGDIDLVWGEVQGSGEQAKGWGLAKIIEKHLNAGDFKAFGEGEQGLINAISEIIQDGKVVTQNGVDSIVLRKNGQEYRVGISKGWDNVGENKWIITSYKNNKYKESAETSYHDTFTSKEPLENPVSTIIPQTQMPKDAPTPPTQKGLFDEVDSSEAPPSKIIFTYTTGEAKGIAELRKDLKQALEPYKSTPITNKETGLQGVVTDTERNKISSKKAVDKSIANGFTRDEHFAAAQHLKNLFENATKAQTHNDYKQRENIAQVHRFVKDLYINDKPAQAKITLFEKIEGKNRIYTLELESLSPTPQSSPHTQAGVAVEAQVTRDVVRPNANIAKTDEESIAQDSNALLRIHDEKV